MIATIRIIASIYVTGSSTLFGNSEPAMQLIPAHVVESCRSAFMLRHRTLILLAFLFTISSAIAARAEIHDLIPAPGSAEAPADSTVSESASGSGRDARLRFGAGVIGGEFYVDNVTIPYLNANYRISLAISPSDEQAVGVGLEGGINYVMPYLSFGPEIRFGNFAITGDMGAAMFPGRQYQAVLPFVNIGGGLISRKVGFGFEANAGCIVILGEDAMTYPYIGISAALR